MIDIALYEPEIPPNTGNIIRLCANTGAVLHLIEPLGFRLDEASVRRAGLDYAWMTQVCIHPDHTDFVRAIGGQRLFAFSARGGISLYDARFAVGDVLLFGPETRGLPAAVLDAIAPAHRLRIPMRPGNRSINLSNAVAVALYEALRQLGLPAMG
ncbi:MAG: tRNA (cytidine(34)-2'-O)-methyltransferase [Gammaproteobacteria bacterium]|nr:tRNA (cytidine(34)-2'-O)-methyltransferase [Gammaproteobacteria bacterium]